MASQSNISVDVIRRKFHDIVRLEFHCDLPIPHHDLSFISTYTSSTLNGFCKIISIHWHFISTQIQCSPDVIKMKYCSPTEAQEFRRNKHNNNIKHHGLVLVVLFIPNQNTNRNQHQNTSAASFADWRNGLQGSHIIVIHPSTWTTSPLSLALVLHSAIAN